MENPYYYDNISGNDTYMYSIGENITEADNFIHLPIFSRMILVLTIVLIIISNALVLVVLPRMKSGLIKMKLFLKSLAMADLWVGLLWFVIHIDNVFSYKVVQLEYWQCLLIIHLLLVVLTVSVLTLSVISVERYIAIVKPFKYHKLITPLRARYAVISMWLLSMVLYLPVYIVLFFIGENEPEMHCEENFMEVLYTCFYLLSVVIVPNIFLSLYCYTCIIKKIKGQEKFASKHGSLRRRSGRRMESKLVKISISLYSGFYITWLPFVAVSVTAYVGTVDINPVVYHATLNTGLWNSILNCLIYSISHEPFRTELKRLFLPVPGTSHCRSCSCCCSSKSSEEPTSAVQRWHAKKEIYGGRLSRSKLTPISRTSERGCFNNEGIVLEIPQNI